MRFLRLSMRVAAVLLVLIPVVAAIALFLAFDRRPTIDRAAEFTPDTIARAKRILDANDPRELRAGTVRTITVTPADADLAVNYLMHRYTNGSGQVTFENGRAHVTLSAHPRGLPSSVFVNLAAILRDGTPYPIIERVRVGSLPVPAGLAEWLLARFFARVFNGTDINRFETVVQNVTFGTSGIAMRYEWHADLAETLRTALVTPDNEERLRVYHQRLVHVSESLAPGSISLVDVLSPVFGLAAERSKQSDPVLENRAAILVLSAYVNGQSLSAVVPSARRWPTARRHRVTLNGRDDFPKHFIISAALAANTGGPFADAVGLYKEVADSRGGSGFSFNDIAADRAGSRLGELAERPDLAHRLQQRLSEKLTERSVMPETNDLPEFMSEAEFTRRYGGVGAPSYNAMTADIERRVGALTAFH